MTELRVFVEPQQGATYEQQLRLARHAEALGFGAFFRSDHYLHMSGDGGPGPTDSYVTLAGLARATSTIRLGTLVTSATFRSPGLLAIQVAQVDEMSGGRIELGLGAGWFEAEHRAYAVPFPPIRERFDRLQEQLEIITGLWHTPRGERYAYAGTHYTVEDSPALPKPMQQPRPPIIIGGIGPNRTPHLAARFADEFNVPFNPIEKATEQYHRVRAACEAIDRAAGEMIYSNAFCVCCGADDAEVARRAANIGRPVEYIDLAGTPAQLIDTIGRWSELGVSRTYLQVLDLDDLDHLALIAAEVMPKI